MMQPLNGLNLIIRVIDKQTTINYREGKKMKTRTQMNLICIITIALVALSLALFINVCSSANGIIDASSNMALFVSLGMTCGVILIMDIVIGTFMGLYKYKTIYGFSVFTLIASTFVAILILLLLFSA